jgi:hypothetical protein
MDGQSAVRQGGAPGKTCAARVGDHHRRRSQLPFELCRATCGFMDGDHTGPHRRILGHHGDTLHLFSHGRRKLHTRRRAVRSFVAMDGINISSSHGPMLLCDKTHGRRLCSLGGSASSAVRFAPSARAAQQPLNPPLPLSRQTNGGRENQGHEKGEKGEKVEGADYRCGSDARWGP